MDENKFNEIYKDIVPRLKIFLRNGWKLTEEDIEEITNDVFIVLHNKTITPFFKYNKSWFYKTTYNKAIDKIRCKKNHEEFLEQECVSNYPSPEEELLDKEQRLWIKNFLNNLNDMDKKISYLCYFENFTYKKIAQIIDIPIGTVKYKLFNIRSKLREEYSLNEKREE